jgi:hypothetical protein
MSEMTNAQRVDAAFAAAESQETVDSAPVATTSDEPLEFSFDSTPKPAVAATSSGGHPAWDEILNTIPEVLRPQVRPALERWDKGVQEQFQKVHQQYDPLKQYQSYADQKVEPDQINTALEIYRILNENPKLLYQQMQEHFGFGVAPSGQGQTGEMDLGEFGDQSQAPKIPDLAQDPRFQQLAQTQEQMAAAFQAQQQQMAEREADIWLNQRTSQIEATFAKKNIQPDMGYILTVASTEAQKTGDYDAALINASRAYETLYNRIASRPTANSSAPIVMSPGGAAPASNTPTIDSLNEKQRRELGAQMLRQAFQS